MGVVLIKMAEHEAEVAVHEAETVFQEAGGFEVGSTVQVGQPPRYGVVRWLGSFPRDKELLAGIELVSS